MLSGVSFSKGPRMGWFASSESRRITFGRGRAILFSSQDLMIDCVCPTRSYASALIGIVPNCLLQLGNHGYFSSASDAMEFLQPWR